MTIRAYYNRYNHGAKSAKRVPLAEADWLRLASQPCAYCGGQDIKNEAAMAYYQKRFDKSLTPEVIKTYEVPLNGIDRIDSARGYEIENCAPCCAMCNRMKLNYTKEAFLNHVKRICEHNHQPNQ